MLTIHWEQYIDTNKHEISGFMEFYSLLEGRNVIISQQIKITLEWYQLHKNEMTRGREEGGSKEGGNKEEREGEREGKKEEKERKAGSGKKSDKGMCIWKLLF